MHITFNSELQEIPAASSITNLLEMRQLQNSKGIAVALNGNVVPRQNWAETTLTHNDSILVIKAAQGG
ncbi:MAG: sulfur carrier protein ThiS [Bacteroidia bacterium]